MTFKTQELKDAAIVAAKKVVADANHAEKADAIKALTVTEDAVITD